MDSVQIPAAQTGGVNDIYEYKEIQLDTMRCDVGNGDNATWNLKTPINDVVGVKLVSATIPFSYYSITDHNGGAFYGNSWVLTDNTGAGPNALATSLGFAAGNSVSLSISPGNYTPTTMAAALALALTNSSVGGWAIYTVSYSSTTGKFAVTSTRVEFWSLSCYDNAGWGVEAATPMLALGLAAGVNTASTNPWIFPNVANLTGPNVINICGSIGGLVNKAINLNGSSNQGNLSTFAQVPVNCNPGGYIEYTDPNSEYYFSVGGGYIQSINMFTTFGNIKKPVWIGYNGAGFNVTLGVLSRRRDIGAVTQSNQVLGAGAKRIRTSY